MWFFENLQPDGALRVCAEFEPPGLSPFSVAVFLGPSKFGWPIPVGA